MKPIVPRLIATVAVLIPLAGFLVPVVALSSGALGQRLYESPASLLHLPVAIAALVIGLSGWTRLPAKIWAAVAMVAGIVLVGSLFPMLGFEICWDGVDANGNWIGACEYYRPAAGFWLSLVGGAGLFFAGLTALFVSLPDRHLNAAGHDQFRADGAA